MLSILFCCWAKAEQVWNKSYTTVSINNYLPMVTGILWKLLFQRLWKSAAQTNEGWRMALLSHIRDGPPHTMLTSPQVGPHFLFAIQTQGKSEEGKVGFLIISVGSPLLCRVRGGQVATQYIWKLGLCWEQPRFCSRNQTWDVYMGCIWGATHICCHVKGRWRGKKAKEIFSTAVREVKQSQILN